MIDDALRARLLINIAADLYELEHYAEALDALLEAEEITRRINHLEYLGEVFTYRTLIALASEQYQEAHRLIDEGQRLVYFWAWGEISWHIVKARTQQAEGQLTEAISTFTRALEMATRMGCGHKVFIIHKFLAQVFRELGQAKAAEYHHKLYQENFHRLLDPQLFNRLTALETQLASYS
jgi:tetratricopeptide (TPR) repeat protein